MGAFSATCVGYMWRAEFDILCLPLFNYLLYCLYMPVYVVLCAMCNSSAHACTSALACGSPQFSLCIFHYYTHYRYLFMIDSLTNLKLPSWASLAQQQVSSKYEHISYILLILVLHLCIAGKGVLSPNSCLHVCKVSSLPPKPAPILIISTTLHSVQYSYLLCLFSCFCFESQTCVDVYVIIFYQPSEMFCYVFYGMCVCNKTLLYCTHFIELPSVCLTFLTYTTNQIFPEEFITWEEQIRHRLSMCYEVCCMNKFYS